MTLVARLSPIIVITVSRTSHSPVFWGLRLRFEEVLVIALRFWQHLVSVTLMIQPVSELLELCN